MSGKEFVEKETCIARMRGTEALAEAAKETALARAAVLEEKIKSLRSEIAIGFTASAFIIVAVQFALRFLT